MHKFFVGLRNVGLWLRQKAMGVVVFVLIAGVVPIHFASAEFTLTNFATSPTTGVILLLAAVIQVLTAAIGSLLLLLIESIVIPILGYNGFYTSHIVGLGWALTRDTVNMFVVAILIFVACATIIGYSKVNWMQQLPKLFLAIVFVNFSKLICGALIDVSQVIMFTFVNAIVSIAAGNFSSMFSLHAVGSFGTAFIQTVTGQSSGIEASQYLIGAYLQFIMIMSVFAVMFLLAVAFIWRIVVLWCLIIMAPLAFFAWGIGDMLHFAASISGDWWKKMVSALTFGPIMVFFLWLALAASSGTNIVNNEAFPMPDSSMDSLDSKIPNESFSLANFLGSFIAIAILLAGIQQASSAAGAMGGFAKQVLEMGTGAVKGLARSPLDAAGGFRRQKDWINKQAKAAGTAASTFAPGLTKDIGTGFTQLGTKMQNVRGLGAIGSAVGSLGGNVISGTKETAKAEMKRGEELTGKQTDEQKLARRLAQANKASGEPDRMKEAGVWDNASLEERNADTKKLLTDPDERTKYQEDLAKHYEKDELKNPAHGGDKKLAAAAAKKRAQEDTDNVMRGAIEYSESDVGKSALAFGAEEKKAVENMKTQNLHLIEPKDKAIAALRNAAPGSADKLKYDTAKREAQKEHLTKMKDEKRLDIRTMSTAAFDDENTATVLKEFDIEDKDGEPVKIWDQFAAGKGTSKQQAAVVNKIDAAMVSAADSGVRSGVARSPADVAQGVSQISTLINAGAIGSKDADGTHDTRRQAVKDVISVTAPSDFGNNSKVHGQASAALLDATDPGASPSDPRVPIFDTEDVFGAEYTTLGGSVGAADSRVIESVGSMLSEDASSARHLEDVIIDDNTANAATKLLADRTTKEVLTKLESIRSGTGSAKAKAAAEKSIEVRRRAIHAEAKAAKAVAGAGGAVGASAVEREKKLAALDEKIQIGNRYII